MFTDPLLIHNVNPNLFVPHIHSCNSKLLWTCEMMWTRQKLSTPTSHCSQKAPSSLWTPSVRHTHRGTASLVPDGLLKPEETCTEEDGLLLPMKLERLLRAERQYCQPGRRTSRLQMRLLRCFDDCFVSGCDPDTEDKFRIPQPAAL